MRSWITAVLVTACTTGAAAQTPPAEVAGRPESTFGEAARAGRFSGVVLVAKDGRPLFARAYGMATGAGSWRTLSRHGSTSGR